MKTSVVIILTILSMAVASPTFWEPKSTHHIIHIPYHVQKVPVYVKQPVYIKKPVYIYRTVEHHYKPSYHHDDHYGHDDYYDHWY